MGDKESQNFSLGQVKFETKYPLESEKQVKKEPSHYLLLEIHNAASSMNSASGKCLYIE